MVLHSYFLAVLIDLETQFGTIRSREVGLLVCLLGAGSLLSLIGMGFWLICLVLPWMLGCWEMWWCARRIFGNIVTELAESNIEDNDKVVLKDGSS